MRTYPYKLRFYLLSSVVCPDLFRKRLIARIYRPQNEKNQRYDDFRPMVHRFRFELDIARFLNNVFMSNVA